MKGSLSLILLLLLSGTFAQTNDVRAKAAFLKAQELYGAADYSGAIQKLEQVKELLGSTNPRVEYLLTQCYFQTKNIEKTDAAIAAYFKLAGDSDINYMDMLKMIEEVDAVREEYNRKKAEREKMEAAWLRANELNTMVAYSNFMQHYADSPYIPKAQEKLYSFPAHTLTDPRDGNTYRTTWVIGQLWMAEDLRYQPLADVDKKTGAYFYSWNKAQSACPPGWKLPSYEMIVKMVQAKLPQAQEVPENGAWGKQRLLTLVDKTQIPLFIGSGWMLNSLDVYRLNFSKGRLDYFQAWSQEGAFRINQPGLDIAIVIENYEFPNYSASSFSVGVCRCVKE